MRRSGPTELSTSARCDAAVCSVDLCLGGRHAQHSHEDRGSLELGEKSLGICQIEVGEAREGSIATKIGVSGKRCQIGGGA